jgi:hypothetical protein
MGVFKISHLQRLPPHYPAYSRHNLGTPNLSGHDLGTDRINQHLAKATQAALTKILPGEEDRFGK